jgi:hypothetical protein
MSKDLRKALEQKAKTLAELNKQCRHTWRVCKDCMAHCEFKDTEQFKGKWVSVEDVEAFLAEIVIVPRKQLDDFLLSNDRNLLEMFCQQGPPSKHWIETKGQFWEGWQACNKSVKDFFAQELLEASDSLSPKETKDVAIARKELASGKCKTFKTADEMIVDLHKKHQELSGYLSSPREGIKKRKEATQK